MTDKGLIAEGNVKLIVENENFIPIDKESIIKDIWKKEKERLGDTLFDGEITCYNGIEYLNNKIIVKANITRYRYLVARDKMPELNINIVPMGVSGACIIKEGNKEYVIFAKRAENMFLAPGQLELVPSGVIDTRCKNTDNSYDYRENLIHEFEEEVKLQSSVIEKITGWYIIRDEIVNSCDICGLMYLSCDKNEILEALKKSDEYDSAIIIEKNEIQDFIKDNEDKMIRTTYYFAKKLVMEL